MIASIDRMYHVDQFVFEISVKMSTSGAKLNNFLWGNEIRGTIYFWNLDAGVSYDWYTRLQEDILTNQKKKKTIFHARCSRWSKKVLKFEPFKLSVFTHGDWSFYINVMNKKISRYRTSRSFPCVRAQKWERAQTKAERSELWRRKKVLCRMDTMWTVLHWYGTWELLAKLCFTPWTRSAQHIYFSMCKNCDCVKNLHHALAYTHSQTNEISASRITSESFIRPAINQMREREGERAHTQK